MIKDYLKEMFEPHLLFGVLCSIIGLAAAYYVGMSTGAHLISCGISTGCTSSSYFNPASLAISLGILAVVGVFLAQMAVNLVDDYVDFKIGIDKETVKTNFSGGSRLVVANKIKLKTMMIIATILLLIALAIGIYILNATNMPLLVGIIIFGGIAVIFYARYITHVPFLAEPLVGLSFALTGLGVFIVSINSTAGLALMIPMTLYVFLPAGLQVGAALTVNEVPDREVDRKYGRRSAVVMLKSNRGAAAIYALFYAVIYILIAHGILVAAIPWWFALLFLMLIPNYLIIKGIRSYKSPQTFEKTMALNALTTLLFVALMCILLVV